MLLDVDDAALGELTEELEILDGDDSDPGSGYALFEDAGVDLSDDEPDPESV